MNKWWGVAYILAFWIGWSIANHTRDTLKIWVDPLTYCHYVVNDVAIQPRLYRDGSQICIKASTDER